MASAALAWRDRKEPLVPASKSVRRSMVCRACGAALVAACAFPVGATAPGPVKQCVVSPAAPFLSTAASHLLSISVHVFAGTQWSHDVVRRAMAESAQLLAQCGIEVSPIEMCVIDAPRRFHFYSTAVSRELLRKLPPTKPALFFVEETRNHPAYDAEAIGRSNAAGRPELADTVWVAHGARDLPQVLAHELVHVLSDSGAHSEEPGNLMRADTSPDATRLTEGQCERLRARAEANGLLQAIRR